jgi:plastocyanin
MIGFVRFFCNCFSGSAPGYFKAHAGRTATRVLQFPAVNSMKRMALTALVAAGGLAATAFAADLTGSVSFTSKRGQKPVISETLVWLEPLSGTKPSRSVTAQMITRSKALVPHVMAIPLGSTIQFPNDDPIIHNLFSVSSVNAFDLGLYKKGAGKTQKFDRAGVVNVYCNVHPNMSAVIHVMETPYYAFADPTGAWRIEDVSSGKYRLNVWSEIGGSAQSIVEVASSGQVKGSLQMNLDSRNYRSAPHLNKYGQPYSRSRSNDY